MDGKAPLRTTNAERQRRFSPSVAHDLNNRLDAVGGLLYLIEAEPNLTEDGRRCLKLAREEIQRLTLLVRESLDAYHDTARRQEVSIPELLDELVELYKTRLNVGSIAELTIAKMGTSPSFHNNSVELSPTSC